jgi:hypothetical protein
MSWVNRFASIDRAIAVGPLATACCVWVASCASHSALVRSELPTPLGNTLTIESKTPPPDWLRTLPRQIGYRFVLGEAEGGETRDQALEMAWASAFVRLGMTEFPELATISSRGVETLHNAQFERRYAINLQSVDWTGVREATDLGSPYVIFDRGAKRFIAFRLLKWAQTDIDRAHRQIQHSQWHPIPVAPEASRREQLALMQAVREVQRLNHEVGYRHTYVERILGEVKCGVTIDDLTRLLGIPDRTNPYNAHLIDKEYYWGDYRVESFGDNPMVAVIGRGDDPHSGRVVCEDLVSQHREETN